MARDRKRAKQRRDRRGAAAARRGAAAGPGPGGSDGADATPSSIRADVPGALDHASAEVDEFDAALVRGAGGVARTDTDLQDDVRTGAEDELQVPPTTSGGGADGGAGGGGDGGDGGGERDRPSGAPLRGGNRAVSFLRASWAELQRVQWPDRRQVTQATAVVLGFVAIAGAYLGLADYVAKEIVEFVLG
ncbi:MAG: preprotein translocase subunit SecE [Solirubrobacterales bacterium]